MTYIVINTFGEPIVAMDEDGEVRKFKSAEEADKWGKDNLQRFVVSAYLE